MRKIVRNILLSCLLLGFSFALTFASLEGYLRYIDYLGTMPAPYPCMEGDPVVNHKFRANCRQEALANNLKTTHDVWYETDARGYRNTESARAAERNGVLLLGDSYTEGFGLNNSETIAFQLNKQMQQRGQRDLWFYNAGVSGYATITQVLQFEHFFANDSFAHVVLNFDFTDIQENLYYYAIASFDDTRRIMALPTRDIFPTSILGLVYSDRSAALRFLHQEANALYLYYLRKKQTPFAMQIVGREPALINQELLDELQLTHCQPAFEFAAKWIAHLKSSVERSGAKFHLHLYAPGYLMKPFRFPRASLSLVRAAENRLDPSFAVACNADKRLFAVFKQFAQEQGIPVYDSHAVFQKRSDVNSLYFDDDAHFTAKGVRVLTESFATSFLHNIQATVLSQRAE